ncbi:DUF6458 family protein [Kitasatospora camelliae]|uniref:DUF6458 family protein n=1 Tax=Kitasatospora camelliae TaxID=3156397 RepID=A0AAU8JT59_9ACTN
MGIGLSIFLIAVGAILAFAVREEVSWVDLDAVGIILMVVGVLGLVVSAALIYRRRRIVHEHVVDEDPATVRRRDERL